LGNFLADMLHPRDYPALSAGVWQGVLLHREIDGFTDRHPLVNQSKARIRPFAGKYAPVIIDVWYDLVAVEQWEEIARIPLEDFQEVIYRNLLEMRVQCPENLRPRLEDMVAHRWLETYRTEAGIDQVFRRMGSRASNPGIVASAGPGLTLHHEGISQDFRDFFPDLVRHLLAAFPLDNPWLRHSGDG